MSRMYVCTFDLTAVTAAIFDLFELTPADDKQVVLHSVYCGQTTELGDAAEEQFEWSIRRGGTAMTSGSGGTSAAAGVALDGSGATSGFTFEALNTTEATFTSGVKLHSSAFNIRAGLEYRPTPEERIGCTQANGGIVVRVESTPLDSVSLVGTAIVEEFG